MSHLDPSASVSSLASTTTEGTPTPNSSTANLLPRDNRSDTRLSAPSSPYSQPGTSCAHPTTTPTTQTYPSSPSSPPKDYEKAYATLSSAWGFGAYVPAKNPESAKTKERGAKKNKQDKKDKKNKQQRREDEQRASQSSSSPVPSTSSIYNGQRSGPGRPLQPPSAQRPSG